jgi:predicted permease
MFLPLTGFVGSPVQDATKPLLRLNERRITTILIVTQDYFRTLGIRLRRGRDFSTRDTADSTRVAVIDEATAKRYWPEYPGGQNPIGQHLLIGGISAKAAEVIGIVATSKQNLENTAWPETVYTAFAQNPQSFATLAVRTMGDPLPVIQSVRAQVRALDRDQPTLEAKTMDALVDAELGQRLLILRLLGSFACVAVLLALIGIYGVLSYSVAQRVQEFGIRRALGAREGTILGSVIRQGLGLTLAGLAIGIGAAALLTRTMKNLLFQVSEVDPATFAGIALLFLLMALAATYIPGRRATRVDPMTALRA